MKRSSYRSMQCSRWWMLFNTCITRMMSITSFKLQPARTVAVSISVYTRNHKEAPWLHSCGTSDPLAY